MALPQLRPAWKNAGPHHEMMIRSSCKRRKLEAAEVSEADAVDYFAPRQAEGEQTLGRAMQHVYLIQEEASVVVANRRSSTSSSSIGNEFNGNSTTSASVVAAAGAASTAAAVAPAGVPGPGNLGISNNMSNKARRVARGGTFRF